YRYRLAQTPGGAGYQGGLSVKLHHIRLLVYFPISSRVFSSDDRSSTLKVLASLSIFLMNPLSTLPGPISTKVSAPSSSICLIESSQSTGLHTCLARRSFISAGDPTISAVTLATSGTLKSLNSMFSSSARNLSLAGVSMLQWNGALTASCTVLLAPLSLHSSIAFSTALVSPAIDIWPGQL